MQPILILAIVAIAAIGLGTGFLNNDFVVMVQQFGIGQGNIDTPIDKATVDFNIIQIVDPTNPLFFKNVIDYCIVTLDAQNEFGVLFGDNLLATDNQGVKQSELVCKLTDMNHNIIAEGKLVQDQFLAGEYHVPVLPVPNAVDVDDVTLIAHANEYTNYQGYNPVP